MYCAVADICYGKIDGEDAVDDKLVGKLIYIKPTLSGRGVPVPYDVYSYAMSRRMFPHEPTSDQWFTESQFESYRALGFHLLEQVVGGRRFDSLAQFMQQVEQNIEKVSTRAENGSHSSDAQDAT